MAINKHVETLHQRHQDLEVAISSEIKHPSYDEHLVLKLKRQKLRIKDQLEELQAQIRPN